MPLTIRNLSAIACRSSGIPELGVYLVNPASRDAMAAALMCSGVSKSGSPAPKPQTSIPSDFIALALLSIERVRDGVKVEALEESCIIRLFSGLHVPLGLFNQGIRKDKDKPPRSDTKSRVQKLPWQ